MKLRCRTFGGRDDRRAEVRAGDAGVGRGGGAAPPAAAGAGAVGAAAAGVRAALAPRVDGARGGGAPGGAPGDGARGAAPVRRRWVRRAAGWPPLRPAAHAHSRRAGRGGGFARPRGPARGGVDGAPGGRLARAGAPRGHQRRPSRGRAQCARLPLETHQAHGPAQGRPHPPGATLQERARGDLGVLRF